jgi:putative selenate reductase
MSVGYNLEGIHTAPMQRFMARMEDTSDEIAHLRGVLREQFPQYADIEIPAEITNSVTLSTMHGCPPDEIEAICRYMLQERGLHTFVKLNPTLLGKETVMRILHDHLGFREIHIPDSVFDHDIKYDRAVTMLRALKKLAAEKGLTFGVKLSNTLAMANHRDALPGDEMYMSGRALYPITMNLFNKLVQEFDGDLNVSYAGGADALNVPTILAAGALPITAASDLLKPGGYARFGPYMEGIQAAMAGAGASSLVDLARDKMDTLAAAAAAALQDRRWKKAYFAHGLPKVESTLEPFDCVTAPCVEQCAVCQDVPEYAWFIAHGQYDQALQAIFHRNPLPSITGYVCTHLCQTRCTRNSYDESVLIRDLKRFAVEHGQAELAARPPVNRRVAVIGSGPAGLAAAYFLALNGIQTTIFEAREMPGGMCAIAPPFRLPPDVVRDDIGRITAMGAELKLNHRVASPPQELLDQGYDAVYVGPGFQKDALLNIEGIDGQGVFTALRFLESVARGQEPDLGAQVLVIGGGNTAMDAARTAQRLTGQPSTIVYRRSQAEMPAEDAELRDFFDEGNRLLPLASPLRIILEEGRVVALECVRNELGEPGADGRRRPVPIPGSEHQIPASAIVLAIGQKPDIAFLDGTNLSFRSDGGLVTDEDTRQTAMECVYAGGDVTRGPAIIIQACEDGRRAAEAICHKLGSGFQRPPLPATQLTDADLLEVKRARAGKAPAAEPALLPVDQRSGSGLVELTLSEKAARAEAARCLQCSALCDKCVEVCPNRANYTYRVTPVQWTLPLLVCQNGELVVAGQEIFGIAQPRQIVHVDDFCNECGNCATFCVHQGKPYTDKPRLFLDEGDFAQEADNAFFISGNTIRRREGGKETTCTLHNGSLVIEGDQFRATMSLDWKIRQAELKQAFEGTLSLVPAAEMRVLLDGATSSLEFLLNG